jgi:hypothetical protein
MNTDTSEWRALNARVDELEADLQKLRGRMDTFDILGRLLGPPPPEPRHQRAARYLRLVPGADQEAAPSPARPRPGHLRPAGPESA